MTQQTQDANDVLMGGGGPPAWKFDEPGTTRLGTISSPPSTRQERDYDPNNPGGGDLKFFPSGDPIMGVIIEVATSERTDTEDDGKRTFYVEGRYIKEAVRNAVKASGSAKLEVGAQLQVTFTHREDPMDKRSRKYWAVTYTPAASAALTGDPVATLPPVAQQAVAQVVPAPPVQQQPDPWAPPAQVAASQPPVAAAPARFVQTDLGMVDTTTGQLVTTAPGVLPASVPANQPPVATPPVQNGPTPEQVAAVRAAGQDPATIWPGFTG